VVHCDLTAESWFSTLHYLQYSGAPLLPSSRRRLSYDDRLEDKRENYGTVLCCAVYDSCAQ